MKKILLRLNIFPKILKTLKNSITLFLKKVGKISSFNYEIKTKYLPFFNKKFLKKKTQIFSGAIWKIYNNIPINQKNGRSQMKNIIFFNRSVLLNTEIYETNKKSFKIFLAFLNLKKFYYGLKQRIFNIIIN